MILLESDLESMQSALWSLEMIKAEIFVDQREFLRLRQTQVLIRQQLCILSADVRLTYTPPSHLQLLLPLPLWLPIMS